MRGDFKILWLAFGALFLSACQTGEVSTNLGGINLEFLKNQPPQEIYENSNFVVGLKLKNSLPQAVEGVEVCVSDIISSEHGGIVGEECDSISMYSAEHREGMISYEEQVLYFPKDGQAYAYKDMGLGPDQTTIIAEVKYPVKTTSTLNICLKKDPTQDIAEISCETNSVFTKNDISDQFSPVVLDKLESTITAEGNSNRIFLDLYFKKSGTGEVFSEGDDQNMMQFKITLGTKDVSFQCNTKKEGYLQFNELSEMVTCNGLLELNEHVEVNSLKVETSYDYKVKITNSLIKIKKLNTGGNS